MVPCTRSGAPKNVFSSRIVSTLATSTKVQTHAHAKMLRGPRTAQGLLLTSSPMAKSQRKKTVLRASEALPREAADRRDRPFPELVSNFLYLLRASTRVSAVWAINAEHVEIPQLMPSDATLGQWATGRDTARQPPTSEAKPPSPAASASCWSIPQTTWKW